MDLNWLETFLAVADRGGFTAASAHVHRSQSRVSSHIASLERELGVRLIDRTHRPAVLTPAGHVFARHARKILAELVQAQSSLDGLNAAGERSVTVVTEPGIGAALLPDLLPQLFLRLPGTRVTLAEKGWPLDGAAPEHGVAFSVAVVSRLHGPLPAGVQERVLWRENLQAVVPGDGEPAFRGRAISPERLLQQSLIVNSSGGPDADFLAGHGLHITPEITVGSPQVLVELVRRRVGVGLENAVALHAVDTRGTVLLDVDHPAFCREVALYWYDSLLDTEVGRALYQSVSRMPLPIGAVGAPGGPRHDPVVTFGPDAQTAGKAYLPVHLLAKRLS